MEVKGVEGGLLIPDEKGEKEQPSPPRRSSPRALLEFIEHSDGWKGDDLDDLLEEVYALRGKF